MFSLFFWVGVKGQTKKEPINQNEAEELSINHKELSASRLSEHLKNYTYLQESNSSNRALIYRPFKLQIKIKTDTRWCVDLCVVFSSGGPSQVWQIYYKTAALKENITNTQTQLSGELRCLTHMPHITHTHKVAWWYMDWLALIDWWIMTRCDSAGKDADGSNECKKACVCVEQMLISPNEIFKSSLRLI